MLLIVKNDEQIKVGTTIGLTAGLSFFIFNGASGTRDFRNYNPVFFDSVLNVVLVQGLDYTWDFTTGRFDFINPAIVFVDKKVYNVNFKTLPFMNAVTPSSIVNNSFFVGELTIPNINGTQQGQLANAQKLAAFIMKREADCLRDILGAELYDLLLSENSSRMTALMYGSSYINYNRRLDGWRGLVYGNNISLIAAYVYYFYERNEISQTTGIAETVAKSPEGVSKSPADKMLNAWNFFAKETEAMSSFLWSKTEAGVKVYPEFTRHNLISNSINAKRNNYFGL